MFEIPPPLDEIPELVTDEPAGQPILARLDLLDLLGGALPAGARVVLERCPADEILSRVRVAGGEAVLRHQDGSDETIAFANPDDHAAVIAALDSDDPRALPNRYLLHLVAGSTHADDFFERANADILTVGEVFDRLPPKPGRYFYRVRAADALGHLSAGCAILAVALRVPSTAPAALPSCRALSGAGGSATLTLAVPRGPDTVWALLFAVVTPPGTPPEPQWSAELLRAPNRHDLYPHDGLRLLLGDGSLLAPLAVKSLSDPLVISEADGTRVVTLAAPATPASWVTLWAFALTRDGRPSPPCGPFGQGVSP